MATVAWVGLMLASGCSEEAAGPATEASSASVEPATPTTSTTASPAAATPTLVADTRTPEERIAAGRVMYNANCIACHAMDPTQDGALGPAVAGSSAELIEARILRGEYPTGYTPKRETRVMVPLPHLQDKLPELVAYLDSLK